MSEAASFPLLDERVQRWVWKQGWASLQPIQENTIPLVLKGDRDLIISAPTGGGKTEAVFLPVLTALLTPGAGSGYGVLYVSPLKALINDQYRRLTEMTSDMGIRVTPWHGDISQSLKSSSFKNPSGILIITPESLESILVNRRDTVANAFAGLRYVVVDEFHSFVGTERGRQLQSQMARIESLLGRIVPRIAMSATLSDYDTVKASLRPGGELPCDIPAAGDYNHEIRISLKEWIAEDGREEEVDRRIQQDIFTRLRKSNNLVFANSRVTVEKYSTDLASMCEDEGVPNPFRAHHGSVSKTERESVEHELLAGSHPVTAVCTCTLELGIDIGSVQSIAQVYSCTSVSSLRQRLGRSGRRGEPSILRIYSVDDHAGKSGDSLNIRLFQNIAVVELIREQRYEPLPARMYHLSTLIQQVLSLLCQFGSFYPKDAWVILCREGAFRNVSAQMFLELLRQLGGQDIVSQVSTGQIVIGKEGEKIVRRMDFYTAFVTDKEIPVYDVTTGKEIGTVQIMEEIGSQILLGGRRWTVVSRDEEAMSLGVKRTLAGGRASYMGEGRVVDRIITEKMRDIYDSGEYYPYLDKGTDAPSALDEGRQAYLKAGLDRTPFPAGGGFYTWAGSRINHTLALAVRLSGQVRDVSYTPLSVTITRREAETLLASGKPDALQLAGLVPDGFKRAQKYDHLLSGDLLNAEYAAASLDIEGAWEVLVRALE